MSDGGRQLLETLLIAGASEVNDDPQKLYRALTPNCRFTGGPT
jgi:hypothetical protein